MDASCRSPSIRGGLPEYARISGIWFFRKNRRALGFILLGLTLGANANAADSYKEVAKFEADKTTLSIRIEFRADGGKRGLMRMDGPAGGGILIYRPRDWDAVAGGIEAAIASAEKLPASASGKIAEVESTGGGFLRIEALNRGRKAVLRLTRRDFPGSKYPDVVIELAAAEFARLQRALDDVATELARK